jgi:hypothetical protein
MTEGSDAGSTLTKRESSPQTPRRESSEQVPEAESLDDKSLVTLPDRAVLTPESSALTEVDANSTQRTRTDHVKSGTGATATAGSPNGKNRPVTKASENQTTLVSNNQDTESATTRGDVSHKEQVATAKPLPKSARKKLRPSLGHSATTTPVKVKHSDVPVSAVTPRDGQSGDGGPPFDGVFRHGLDNVATPPNQAPATLGTPTNKDPISQKMVFTFRSPGSAKGEAAPAFPASLSAGSKGVPTSVAQMQHPPPAISGHPSPGPSPAATAGADAQPSLFPPAVFKSFGNSVSSKPVPGAPVPVSPKANPLEVPASAIQTQHPPPAISSLPSQKPFGETGWTDAEPSKVFPPSVSKSFGKSFFSKPAPQVPSPPSPDSSSIFGPNQTPSKPVSSMANLAGHHVPQGVSPARG